MLQELHGTSANKPCIYDTTYHLVWSPKYLKWLLREDIQERVKELFQEIANIFVVSTEILHFQCSRYAEKHQCKRNIQRTPRSQEVVIEWRILGRPLYYEDRWRQTNGRSN